MNRDEKISRLGQICANLDTLCSRVERRVGQEPADFADQAVNLNMAECLMPVQQAFHQYCDFYESCAEADGRVPGDLRECALQGVLHLFHMVERLTALHDRQMGDTTEFGRPRTLSKFFQGIVNRDRADVWTLIEDIAAIAEGDIADLRVLEEYRQSQQKQADQRPEPRKPGLTLVYSRPDKPDLS